MTPLPIPPEGWDIVPTDINEASLRMELRKLRNKNKGKNMQEEEKTEEVIKKDDKKGAKGPTSTQKVEENKGIFAT